MMKGFSEKTLPDVLAFTSMFDIIKDLVFLMEAEENSFRYIYVNPSGMQVLQIEKEMARKRIEDVLPKDQSRRLIPKYQQVISTKQPVEFIETLEIENREFTGETSLNPILTEDGQCKYVLAIVRDITERKQKERELKKIKEELERNQKRLKSLVENNGDAVYELDKEGNFLDINQMVTNITGYEENELIGRSVFDLVTEDSLVETSAYFNRALLGRKEEYLTCLQKRNGEKVHLLVKNVPILVDGIIVGVYGIAKDLTQKNQLEFLLKESELKYKSLFDHHPDAIFSYDLEGRFTSGNTGVERLTGYSRDEFLGKSFVPMMVPEDVEKTLYHFNKAIKEKKAENYEVALQHKQGYRVDLFVMSIPIIMDGEVTGIYGLAKDVTETKRVERALKEREEKYRLITENAFDVIKLIDSSGIVEYISPSNEVILGYTSPEYVGKLFTANVHPEDIPKVEKGFEGLIKGNEPSTIEIRLLHKKGHWIWLEVATTPIIDNGEVKQVVTIARDITERKNYRDELAKMAFYDYLSGLPNRRMFEERLDMAIHQADRSRRKVAVMMLDGRKFKRINDTFGHDAGDAVIQEMAKRLQKCVRKTDTVARLGGDEIGIVLPELDSIEVARDIAKRILHSFEEPLCFNNVEIELGAGIGIAFYPDHATAKKQLIKYADEALYKAKEFAKNEYLIYR